MSEGERVGQHSVEQEKRGRDGPSNVEEEALRGHISRSESTSLCLGIDNEEVAVLLRVVPTAVQVSNQEPEGD